jgi:hypothetical protein
VAIDHAALRNVRMWIHDQDMEWTEQDIESVAWLLAHTEAKVVADSTHPDFARVCYRCKRMQGFSRDATLAGMAEHFAAPTVDYVRAVERN